MAALVHRGLLVAAAVATAAESAPLKIGAFSKPSGAVTSLAVSGTIRVGEMQSGTADSKLVIFGTLAGLDTACDGTKTFPECAIKFFTGTCADILDPFYDPEIIPTALQYQSTGGGDFMVTNSLYEIGKSLEETQDKVFVVNDGAANAVACAELEAVAASSKDPLRVQSFTKYPGYDGALELTGTAEIYQLGLNSQYITYALEGADTLCTAESLNAKGCGIHIHVGGDCADESTIGGPYYSAATDPWGKIQYFGPTFKGTTVTIRTNMKKSGILGRVLVVRDNAGAPIACGKIVVPVEDDVPLVGESFGPVDGGGATIVAGNVTTTATETSTTATSTTATSTTATSTTTTTTTTTEKSGGGGGDDGGSGGGDTAGDTEDSGKTTAVVGLIIVCLIILAAGVGANYYTSSSQINRMYEQHRDLVTSRTELTIV